MGDKKKKTFMFIRLVSAAGTGFFYVKRKSAKKVAEKLEFRKYDPRTISNYETPNKGDCMLDVSSDGTLQSATVLSHFFMYMFVTVVTTCFSLIKT